MKEEKNISYKKVIEKLAKRQQQLFLRCPCVVRVCDTRTRNNNYIVDGQIKRYVYLAAAAATAACITWNVFIHSYVFVPFHMGAIVHTTITTRYDKIRHAVCVCTDILIFVYPSVWLTGWLPACLLFKSFVHLADESQSEMECGEHVCVYMCLFFCAFAVVVCK